MQQRQTALLAARGDRVAALKAIRSHEEELDGSVAKIQAKIAAQLAGYGSVPLPAGPIRGGSSGLIWPVNGPVVSGFGSRTINGSYEYHPGIDIAVPSGTPIRAAAAGTVIFTEPEASSGGYGNYTCIDHGGGLSTCYAHQETFAVSAGQQVSQGQIIGYSDCTGTASGRTCTSRFASTAKSPIRWPICRRRRLRVSSFTQNSLGISIIWYAGGV